MPVYISIVVAVIVDRAIKMEKKSPVQTRADSETKRKNRKKEDKKSVKKIKKATNEDRENQINGLKSFLT